MSRKENTLSKISFGRWLMEIGSWTSEVLLITSSSSLPLVVSLPGPWSLARFPAVAIRLVGMWSAESKLALSGALNESEWRYMFSVSIEALLYFHLFNVHKCHCKKKEKPEAGEIYPNARKDHSNAADLFQIECLSTRKHVKKQKKIGKKALYNQKCFVLEFKDREGVLTQFPTFIMRHFSNTSHFCVSCWCNAWHTSGKTWLPEHSSRCQANSKLSALYFIPLFCSGAPLRTSPICPLYMWPEATVTSQAALSWHIITG